MRQKQKLVERLALSLFAKALETRGIAPIHAPEITDAPDALFLIEDQPVAVECRYLSHPKLLRLLGPNDWPPDRIYEVFLPTEPHLWVRDAILEKNPHIQRYKTRTGASQAWLLLHSSSRQKILRTDRPPESDFFQLLCLGAYLTPHDFDQIWIAELSGDYRLAMPIYGPGQSQPLITFEDYIDRQVEPFDHFWFANVVIKANENGGKCVSVNINDLVAEPVCLEPLDSRLVIDYEAILADPARSANLKNLHAEYYDTPPTY